MKKEASLIDEYRRDIERAGPTPAHRRKMAGLKDDPDPVKIAVLDDILRKIE
jgi:hypothetical protein